jgi:demethylmenaquinone methyltransferase/2-methoxy-6-polyprenyl-1,4-benzoquinol methylase
MRLEAVSFATREGALTLDLGAGPGTMSRVVSGFGGDPILLDASRAMLKSSGFPNAVQAVFELLPFRDHVFDASVSGFAIRDAHDLKEALREVARVLKPGSRFSICDLGKPDGAVKELVVGYYLRVVPPVIGLATTGRTGLRYASLFDTYILVLHNSQLVSLLRRYLGSATIHETQMGGSIVVKCTRSA